MAANLGFSFEQGVFLNQTVLYVKSTPELPQLEIHNKNYLIQLNQEFSGNVHGCESRLTGSFGFGFVRFDGPPNLYNYEQI